MWRGPAAGQYHDDRSCFVRIHPSAAHGARHRQPAQRGRASSDRARRRSPISIATVSTTSSSVTRCAVSSRWIRQAPRGTFTEQTIAGVAAPAHAEVVDFDKDGDLDLLVAALGFLFPNNNRVGSVIVLENDGDAALQVALHRRSRRPRRGRAGRGSRRRWRSRRGCRRLRL